MKEVMKYGDGIPEKTIIILDPDLVRHDMHILCITRTTRTYFSPQASKDIRNQLSSYPLVKLLKDKTINRILLYFIGFHIHSIINMNKISQNYLYRLVN